MASLTYSNGIYNIAITGTFTRNQKSGAFTVKSTDSDIDEKNRLVDIWAANANMQVQVTVINNTTTIYNCLIMSISKENQLIQLKILSEF